MKKIGMGLIVAMCLLGAWTLVTASIQAREDYQNFRKIVIWVAQKQAQEAEYARRQAAQRAPAQTPVPAPAVPQ